MSYIDFDFNLVKTFINVYEENSISKAAKKMFITQPAITQNIKKLETLTNTKLFVRTQRGTLPTEEAKILYDNFKQGLNLFKNGISQIQEKYIHYNGEIFIGSSSNIIRFLLLPFIVEFKKEYPNVKISIIDGISTQLVELLNRGDIDFAILTDPAEDIEKFEKVKLCQINDCFIVNKNFEYDFLDKTQLKDYPLFLQKLPSSNRVFFDKMCSLNQIELSPSLESESLGLIVDFVSKGEGIGFTIKNFINKNLIENNIKILKTNFVIEPRNINLYHYTNMSGLKNLFITKLSQYYIN